MTNTLSNFHITTQGGGQVIATRDAENRVVLLVCERSLAQLTTDQQDDLAVWLTRRVPPEDHLRTTTPRRDQHEA